MTNNISRNIILFIFAVVFTLALSEGILRLFDFQPWKYEVNTVNEPVMLEPDPVLGWRNKKGRYDLPRFAPEGNEVTINFLENGRRKTRSEATTAQNQLIFVGGSYTQGWALNDEDTFAWKVQQQHPEFDVINYGTGGYGTFQSLLTLEKELPKLSSPKQVIYGFIHHHAVRNTASGKWLRQLTQYSHRGHVNLPYGSINENNKLQHNAPEHYIKLPFRESLALVAFIERVYMKLKSWDRFNHRREITEQTLLEMKQISEAHGARFSVVILTSSEEPKTHYLNFARENGIQGIDCVVPCSDCLYDLPRNMMIPGDGHPNAELNDIWGRCISESLKSNSTVSSK